MIMAYLLTSYKWILWHHNCKLCVTIFMPTIINISLAILDIGKRKYVHESEHS